MLVMAETDEIDTHVFHHLHFSAHHIFSHCLGNSGMVFMAVRSAKQKAFTIQEEGAFFFKFRLAEAEMFFCGQRLSGGVDC